MFFFNDCGKWLVSSLFSLHMRFSYLLLLLLRLITRFLFECTKRRVLANVREDLLGLASESSRF